MLFRATIKKDGRIVTKVLDRGSHLCSSVYKLTNAIGQQLSDEDIGPECDLVDEVIMKPGKP